MWLVCCLTLSFSFALCVQNLMLCLASCEDLVVCGDSNAVCNDVLDWRKTACVVRMCLLVVYRSL